MIWYTISFPTHFYTFTNICVCVHLYLYTLDMYTHVYGLHIISIILQILFCKLISLLIYHRYILMANCPHMLFYQFTLPPRGMLSNTLSNSKGELSFPIFTKLIYKETHYYFILMYTSLIISEVRVVSFIY